MDSGFRRNDNIKDIFRGPLRASRLLFTDVALQLLLVRLVNDRPIENLNGLQSLGVAGAVDDAQAGDAEIDGAFQGLVRPGDVLSYASSLLL